MLSPDARARLALRLHPAPAPRAPLGNMFTGISLAELIGWRLHVTLNDGRALDGVLELVDDGRAFLRRDDEQLVDAPLDAVRNVDVIAYGR